MVPIKATPRPELQRRAARYHKRTASFLLELGYPKLAERVLASPGATLPILQGVHRVESEKSWSPCETTNRFIATILIP